MANEKYFGNQNLTQIGSIAGLATDLAIAEGGTGASTAGDARTNLGLGTIATQSASSVSITGGSITGITDLAVADGGTGASTAGDARTNLGLGTIATQSASSVSITGGSITGITDLAVADGGTGASTASAARVNLGVITDMYFTSSYAVGNISIGTGNDGAFADVDASNAKITFTITATGKYQVIFSFTKYMEASGLGVLESNTGFRLTDGTNNSPPVSGGGTNTLTGYNYIPFTLVHVFNFASTGSKTVKLQKYNNISANVGTRSVNANSSESISMYVARIAD